MAIRITSPVYPECETCVNKQHPKQTRLLRRNPETSDADAGRTQEFPPPVTDRAAMLLSLIFTYRNPWTHFITLRLRHDYVSNAGMLLSMIFRTGYNEYTWKYYPPVKQYTDELLVVQAGGRSDNTPAADVFFANINSAGISGAIPDTSSLRGFLIRSVCPFFWHPVWWNKLSLLQYIM